MATLLSQHYARSSRLKIRRAYACGIRCRLWPDPLTPRFIGGGTLLTSLTSGFVNVFFPALRVAGCVEFSRCGFIRDRRWITQMGGFVSTFRKPYFVWSSQGNQAVRESFLFCYRTSSVLSGLSTKHVLFPTRSLRFALRRTQMAPSHLWRLLGKKGRTQAFHLEGSKEFPNSANAEAKN